jgi:hypothetical protein
MRMIGRVAASAALVVAASGATLVGAAHADDPTATPSAPSPTRIAATVSPHWIQPGGSSTVSGTLLLDGAPYADQSVELLARLSGSKQGLAVAETGTTEADGSVEFTVTPAAATIYRLRYLGDATSAAATSHRVEVHPAHRTRLRIVVGGGSDHTVSGRLAASSHGLRHRSVQLQEMTSGGWVRIAGRLSGYHGWVRFGEPVSGHAGTYRLSFAGDHRYLASTSATVTIG